MSKTNPLKPDVAPKKKKAKTGPQLYQVFLKGSRIGRAVGSTPEEAIDKVYEETESKRSKQNYTATPIEDATPADVEKLPESLK